MKELSDYIYESFALFMSASNRHSIIEMSAGVNWQKAPECVKKSLYLEIEYDLSYRNYGRSAGGKIVTDIIELCEKKECDSDFRLKCALTNGAADGAHCLISYLLRKRIINKNSMAMIVGLAFPVYSSLMRRFDIAYKEIYSENTIVPEQEELLDSLIDIRPDLIFLALPHNPSGLLKSANYYRAILNYAVNNDAVVVFDRVCLMPWDNTSEINQMIYPYVYSGTCFIIDSLSKSNSLAGLRLGYALMSEKYINDFEKELRYRSLNPVVFGSITLALCRLGDLAISKGKEETHSIVRFIRRYSEVVYKQYPSDFVKPDFDIGSYIDSFITDYTAEILGIKNRLITNFESIKSIFEGLLDEPLVFDAGFNVLFRINSMHVEEEIKDQMTLANEYGICVLTQRCFQANAPSNGLYFIRLSLTIPQDSFTRALKIMKRYYTREKKEALLCKRDNNECSTL